MRIFYVDDSGDEEMAVLAAIGFELGDWRRVLTGWLGWRKWLWGKYRLPVDFELHAQEFVSGRGEIAYRGEDGETVNPPIDRTPGLRREAYKRCLAQIERQAGISVLAVAERGVTLAALYQWFIGELDGVLGSFNEEAMVVVDGLDDSRFRPAHRSLELKTRRIIEDPLMQSSRHSQLIQMADLVAHAAFQHEARDPDRRFMWDWYPDLLEGSIFAAEWGHPAIWRP
jgi:hypothetical protein